MSFIEKAALVLVIALTAVTCLRLLRRPLKLLVRLAISSSLGFGALWLLQYTSAYTGLSLGLNLFNVLTVGVLGLPGLGLLVLLQWVLT